MEKFPNYRITAQTGNSKAISYADKIEIAKEIATAIDGKIEVYIYGIGWVRYTESMEGKND